MSGIGTTIGGGSKPAQFAGFSLQSTTSDGEVVRGIAPVTA
jgi:hypothetical protein